MAEAPRRLVSAEKRPEDDAALRPQTLADFVGQQAARRNLQVFIDSAKTRGEALDHVLFVGPPGLGKTTLAQIVARELGVNFRSTSGPVHRQGWRSRRAVDQSRTARRALHRRDPPPQPGGRGNPLSRYGGFPARPHHRVGAGGPSGQDRPREVHAGRRDHPRGAPHYAPAGPVRHPDPAELLHDRGTAGDHQARRAGDRRRRSPNDGANEIARRVARHAAHRGPPAAPGAGLRRRWRARRSSAARWPTER